MVNDKNLSEENIWALTAMHDMYRRSNDYPACALIQAEIERRSILQRAIASQLNYYQPLDLSHTLFREVA